MQSSIFVKEGMLVEKTHVRIPSYGPEQKINFFCAHRGTWHEFALITTT
jgi:hypothetical protein